MASAVKKNQHGLTAAQDIFATELASGSSQSDAYRKAYPRSLNWKDEVVWRKASELASHGEVQGRVRYLQEKACQKNEITVEKVLKRYWDIATANPNDLMQYRRECCRHCYGKEHNYQWIDENEFFKDEEEYQKQSDEIDRKNSKIRKSQIPTSNNLQIPVNDGGYGFDPSLSPHAKCPICHGKGKESVYIADTRELKGGAALLYAGVKATSQGLEIKTHDQLHALDKVASYLGMDKKILGGDKQNPIAMFLAEVGSSVHVVDDNNSELDLDDE